MKEKLLVLLLFFIFSTNAQVAIFNPTMSVTATGSVSSPTGEQVAKIIDGNVNTKFLDFNSSDGFGFVVNLGNVGAIPNSMEVTTANDSPERDPMNYEIAGSNSNSNFTVITSGTIACDPTRFFSRTFNFSNTNGYSYYRVNFTNQCNTIEQMFQLSEVQLFGTILAVSDFSFVERNISLFPNPTTSNFTIKNNGLDTIDKIVIIDALGKIVKQEVFNNLSNEHQIDVATISSGVYLVKAFSGDKSINKKLIIN